MRMRILTVLLALMAGATVAKAETLQTAIFAGGCFWCVESDFDKVEGVVETVSGYTGGTLQNATYRNHGQHREAVKITFDADVVSYDQLLYVFWRTVDATDAGGQFCDRGHSYLTGIFALNDEQAAAARASKAALRGRLGAPIVTEVFPAGDFWDAENYHQNYYQKNPNRYDYYRNGCGRDARVAALWGDEAPFANDH
ncbi:MAG: peptide-methionine (S)-S-oxide reductase MsrA [Rhodobacteraceae bacterium]|nr:peptide-methionine (S)-S-oxide reductase MsrA [Paracoccaceae bacterium]